MATERYLLGHLGNPLNPDALTELRAKLRAHMNQVGLSEPKEAEERALDAFLEAVNGCPHLLFAVNKEGVEFSKGMSKDAVERYATRMEAIAQESRTLHSYLPAFSVAEMMAGKTEGAQIAVVIKKSEGCLTADAFPQQDIILQPENFTALLPQGLLGDGKPALLMIFMDHTRFDKKEIPSFEFKQGDKTQHLFPLMDQRVTLLDLSMHCNERSRQLTAAGQVYASFMCDKLGRSVNRFCAQFYRESDAQQKSVSQL
jgi:hypothetical protein